MFIFYTPLVWTELLEINERQNGRFIGASIEIIS